MLRVFDGDRRLQVLPRSNMASFFLDVAVICGHRLGLRVQDKQAESILASLRWELSGLSLDTCCMAIRLYSPCGLPVLACFEYLNAPFW